MRWLGSGPRVLAAGCEGLLTGFLDGRKVLLG